MGDTVLGTTVKEKDLVTISADMNVSEQCGIQIIELIRRNITYTEGEKN